MDETPIPAALIEPDAPAVTERWSIKTRDDAEWAMARLTELDAEMRPDVERAVAWHARIEAWLVEQTAEADKAATTLSKCLESWALDERERTGKATIKLVAGTIKTTAAAAAVEIEDQAAVVAWVRDVGHEGLVRVAESVLVTDLRTLAGVAEVVVQSKVELECGHGALVDGLAAPGEVVRCRTCHDDGELGDPMQPVVAVVEELMSARVEHAGMPVPGTRVRPATVNVKVQPRT